jgi:ABC-type glycerol-3-phosphate transport system permease component
MPIGGLWIGLVLFLVREFGLANEALAMIFAFAFLLLPISILVARDYLQRRVLAPNANEYWKEGPC